MKKRITLLTAGMMLSAGIAGTVQSAFAGETGGIQKIADMITEARGIKEGTMMLSVSVTYGEKEVSAGTMVSMTPDSASVDMLYLSVPNDDGTFYDLVSEDVLRIFGIRAYLNTGLIDDIVSALSEEEKIEDDENVVQAADSLSGDWIGLVGIEMGPDGAYDEWTELLAGFSAAHDAGSYTINLGNEQIQQVLERLDMQIEEGRINETQPVDLEELLTPYAEAIIKGRKEADEQSVTDEEKEKEQMFEDINAAASSVFEGNTEKLAERFSQAVLKGLDVNASICAGKDGAAGTYAFEVVVEAIIPRELQKEWGIDELELFAGDEENVLTENGEMETKNASFNFVVSLEPSEEPIEIEEPQDRILWLEDLLESWAADGLIEP